MMQPDNTDLNASNHSIMEGVYGKISLEIKDVIMDPGDDEEFDSEEFIETRLELENSCHNLVIN
jgi:hypothetical protein